MCNILIYFIIFHSLLKSVNYYKAVVEHLKDNAQQQFCVVCKFRRNKGLNWRDRKEGGLKL